tara:strand:- start:84 stop:1208 length:1125 start_codon:yes stop_codon:yes gene_type:complete
MPDHDQTTDDQTTEEEEEQETFPIYSLESQTPDFDMKNLQFSYGTYVLPMFEWVKKVQTGEKAYDQKDPMDEEMMDRYEKYIDQYGQPEGMMSPSELISAGASALGTTIGAPIGGAIGMKLFGEGVTGKDAFSSILPFGGGKGALNFAPDQMFDPQTGKEVFAKGGVFPEGARAGANILQQEGVEFLDIFKDQTQIARAGGQAVGNFAVQLIAGEDPASAARKAGASALASHTARAIFTPLLGPVGGAIAGFVGGALGGRVICNELHKQGLLTKEQVLMDYKFTRDYLTPTHVNGYHLWAVWVVKQMRKGRMVKFWKHIATHRANEIAYIYGKREKPDYLGKIYRRIGEPVCWLLGTFKKSTDWSVLYKEKNNG